VSPREGQSLSEGGTVFSDKLHDELKDGAAKGVKEVTEGRDRGQGNDCDRT
jgi:hypothetical protein